MNLYIAGIYMSNISVGSRLYARLLEHEQQTLRDIPHHLESYHYIRKGRFTEDIRKTGQQVFLDSGAYSSYTKGVEVSLDDYCTYIQENDDILLKEDGVVLASVLDAIGDPLKTWRNQRTMEQKGVTPLPCFHYGDDERYLVEYIKKYDYITLGGMVATHNKLVRIWLDRIWEKYLSDGSGNPRLKVHGFGLMAEDFLAAYPWHSVDSSTWVQKAFSGMCLGHTLNGFLLPDLHISKRSPRIKVAGGHYDTMSDSYRELYRKDIEQRGYSPERIGTFYGARWAYNIQVMNDLNKKYAELKVSFKSKQRGLF